MAGVSLRFGVSAAVSVLAATSLAFHSIGAVPSKAKESWKTGYWVWAGDAPATATFTPQLLYVEAPGKRWPRNLPHANQYVIVQRLDPASPLTPAAAGVIADRYRAVVEDAGSG